MKMIDNTPEGIMIFTEIFSLSESEQIIDAIENSIESTCGVKLDIPSTYSPDISSFRSDIGFNISEHSFENKKCFCGITEVDSMLGMKMMESIDKYCKKYGLALTQDEGFSLVKQTDDHISDYVIDDNPFVNRLISYHLAFNFENPITYMNFKNFDFNVTVSKPTLVIFPSNFIYSYSKPQNLDLYEIVTFFNDNPTEEIFDQIFNNSN